MSCCGSTEPIPGCLCAGVVHIAVLVGKMIGEMVLSTLCSGLKDRWLRDPCASEKANRIEAVLDCKIPPVFFIHAMTSILKGISCHQTSQVPITVGTLKGCITSVSRPTHHNVLHSPAREVQYSFVLILHQ